MADSTINIFGSSGEAMVGADTINTILASMDSKLTSDDINIETLGDGTVDVDVKNDTYTINLNHTHENMAKLVVCEESDLPSTLDPATIYAQVDDVSTPLVIEKLWIAGLEFVGGSGNTDPKLVSPQGTSIDFGGQSEKTVTVKGVNLTEALTVDATGFTASAQTISVSDATTGVTLTLTKGSSFSGGTLRIYSSEVDKSWTVVNNDFITAVKFTKKQYITTDIYPGPNTRLEIDMKLDGTYQEAGSTIGTSYSILACNKDTNYDPAKTFSANTGVSSEFPSGMRRLFIWAEAGVSSGQSFIQIPQENLQNRSTFIVNNVSHQASFNGGSVQIPTKTTTMPTPMIFGGNTGGLPFGLTDLIVYSIKHYESDVLTHEYLPATSSGVVGFYDTVTHSFISSETSYALVEINS